MSLPYDDAMAAMYVAISNLQSVETTDGRKSVAANKVASDKALADQIAAQERADANQADSGSGFFASLGKLASDFLDDLATGHIADAFTDAGDDASAAWNSPHFWSDLAAGLSVIGAACEGVSAIAMVLGPAGVAVGCVLGTAGAIALAGSALAQAREEHFAAAAEDADADATQAKDHMDTLKTSGQNVLADLKDLGQSNEGALQSIAEAIATNDQTLVTASSIRVKG